MSAYFKTETKPELINLIELNQQFFSHIFKELENGFLIHPVFLRNIEIPKVTFVIN